MIATFPTLRQAGLAPVPNWSLKRGSGGVVQQPRNAGGWGTLTDTNSPLLQAIAGPSGSLAARVTEFSAMCVSTVYACVDYIADMVSTLPLELYRRRGGRTEIADDHPARDLLKYRPNPTMTAGDVRYALAWNAALYGNGYAQILWDRLGRPAELWPIESKRVRLVRRSGDVFPNYYVQSEDGGLIQLGFDSMLHIRRMTSDGAVGVGPMHFARTIIGLAQAIDDNTGAFFANGSRPGMVYSLPPGVSLKEDQMRALEEQIRARYEGLENAFRLMVVQGGGKIESLRTTNGDSQLAELRAAVQVSICQIFRVPPHKVQVLDRATFSNIEQQQIQAVQDLFLPLCARWEQTFAGALLSPRERRDHFFKHSLNGLMRGDSAARAQFYASGKQNGWLSINEIREWEDLNPIEGGDGHYHQSNLIGINEPSPAAANRNTSNERRAA